jgi:hypothetical protein
LKLFDHLWRQFDFEWDSRFKRGHERFGLPRIVEHLRPFSSSDSVSQMIVIMDQQNYLALPLKMDFRHVPFATRRETGEEQRVQVSCDGCEDKFPATRLRIEIGNAR